MHEDVGPPSTFGARLSDSLALGFVLLVHHGVHLGRVHDGVHKRMSKHRAEPTAFLQVFLEVRMQVLLLAKCFQQPLDTRIIEITHTSTSFDVVQPSS